MLSLLSTYLRPFDDHQQLSVPSVPQDDPCFYSDGIHYIKRHICLVVLRMCLGDPVYLLKKLQQCITYV